VKGTESTSTAALVEVAVLKPSHQRLKSEEGKDDDETDDSMSGISDGVVSFACKFDAHSGTGNGKNKRSDLHW
jgi:hypothetical protein